jgi:hypothetical protein
MDLDLYRWLHLAGVIFLFSALGAAVLLARAGNDQGRKWIAITHGLALLVILVSGFGALAKLGMGFPPWVWIKLLIWLLLGAAVVLVRKMPQRAGLWWVLLPLLGAAAAWLGIFKPF